MGRKGYPVEFRRRVLDLSEAGRSVAEVAQDLGISDQTVYNWRRQDRIDRDPGARDERGRAHRAGGRKRKTLAIAHQPMRSSARYNEVRKESRQGHHI